MQRAHKICYVVASVFATYALAGSAAAQEPQPQEQPPPKQQPKPPSEEPSKPGMEEQTGQEPSGTSKVMAARMTATATIEKVNAKKREVTLKDEQGNKTKINVPADAGDLSKLKKGDTVTIDYFTSVALGLQKTEPGKTQTTKMTEKQAAELPGGKMSKKVTGTAEVVKVDTSANTVTIKSPQSGENDTIHISDPQMQQDLSKLKAGDKIRVSYMEAIAVHVSPPEKTGQGPKVEPEKTPDQKPMPSEPKKDY